MSLLRDPDAFAALNSRNYRLYLLMQVLAHNGLWMKRLTMSWLVYRLTDSGFWLGFTEVFSYAPILLLGMFAGAWLDRHDLRRTLIVTQTLCLGQALLLAGLCFAGNPQFWEVAVIGFLLGMINAVDLPCRQSAVSSLVDNLGQLKSAVALHSMVFNTSRLIGPSIAGFIIYEAGEGVSFLVSAFMYCPVILALIFKLHFRPRTVKPKQQNVLQGVKEGLAYVQRVFVLRHIFLLLGTFSILTASYSVLFPMFTTTVLGGDSKLLGILFGAVGFGAVAAAMAVTTSVRLRDIPTTVILLASVAMGGMAVFSLSTLPWLSTIAAAFFGFGMAATFVSVNTLVQTVAEEDKRSRVISLYTMCGAGLAPMGGLVFGSVADLIGAPWTMLACAVGTGLLLASYARFARQAKANLAELLAETR